MFLIARASQHRLTFSIRRISTLNPRSSIYAGNRTSSIVKNTVGPIHRDPRNIKDKRYQQASIKIIVDYLTEAGYGHSNIRASLMQLSGKEFQNIFKFLHGRIDPSYQYEMKRFEDEVPSILKMLK